MAYLFFNPCACTELHQQEHAQKLCSATLSGEIMNIGEQLKFITRKNFGSRTTKNNFLDQHFMKIKSANHLSQDYPCTIFLYVPTSQREKIPFPSYLAKQR